MKERICWLVWGLLLVGNIVWWWRNGVMAGTTAGEAESVQSAGERPLVELVRLGQEEWARLRTTGKVEEGELPEHPVLRRAEWLLRLREAEARLRAKGVEVAVAEELEKWLDGGTNSRNGARVQGMETAEDYLSGITRWCDEWSAVDGGARLVRVWLAPGRAEGYPEVQVELSGRPERAGSQLLAADVPAGGWRWGELELWRADTGSDWWLRGVLRYGGGK